MAIVLCVKSVFNLCIVVVVVVVVVVSNRY